MDSSALWSWRRWRLPWLRAAAFDVRNDREKATDYLMELARQRAGEYLDQADDDTMRDIFDRAGMIRKADRTPRERRAAYLARTAQFIFFGCWALFALHLLRLF